MIRSVAQKSFLACGALALILTTAQCGESGTSEPGRAVSLAPLSASQAAMVVSKGLLPNGLARVNWMAEVHTQAMQEGMRSGPALQRASARERCILLKEVTRNIVPAVMEATGISDAAFFEQNIAQSFERSGCARTPRLSIWNVPATFATTQDEVTGDFLLHTPGLENAILQSSTPEGAVAAMNSVLSNASGLGAPDFEVLAGLASLAASSVYYWYAVEQSGGGGGGGPGVFPEPMAMSIFQSRCGFWCRMGWADVAGGVAGALSVYSSGFGTPQTILADSVIWGVASSILYAM